MPSYLHTTSPSISPQASLRVTTTPAFDSGVSSSPLSLRVTVTVVPRTVLIERNNGRPVTPRYPLLSRRQGPSPAKQCFPHLVAACAKASTGPNLSSSTYGTRPLFVTATCLLILAARQPSPESDSFIKKVTGKALEYHYLACGTNKAIWSTRLANDLGRLAQCVGTRIPTGTNTVCYFPRAIFLTSSL